MLIIMTVTLEGEGICGMLIVARIFAVRRYKMIREQFGPQRSVHDQAKDMRVNASVRWLMRSQ